MTQTDRAHVVEPERGRTVDLGVARMRLLAGGTTAHDGAFALTEFAGTEQGPWTLPHVHREFEESFFILEGNFRFTVAEESISCGPGTYLLVPRGSAHMIEAGEGGGRFLTLMVPGGLEEMFFELGALSPDALRDPAIRAEISARYDSIPV